MSAEFHSALPALPPDFTLRAPWPDELPGLRSLFDLVQVSAKTHLRVLLRETPERIIGGFLLTEPTEPGPAGTLLLRIRPAYRDTPMHAALFAAARTVAREAGLSALHTSVAPGASARACFLAQGARHVKTDCFYQGDWQTARVRLQRLCARLGDAEARFTVRSMLPEDHPVLAEMAATHGLLNAERAALSLRQEHDAALSTVCTEGEKVVGAMLLRPTGNGSIYIEVLMVHPAHTGRSGLISVAMISLACESCLAAGFTKFSLSCDPAKNQETVNLARRMQCRQIGEHQLLRWDF